jgi:hypothetical protein
MINGLWFMQFLSRPDSWNSALHSIEHPEKYEGLTPITMQSEETFNTNIVDNFLNFPTAICMHYFDKHNKSYSHWKAAIQCRFQQKGGNRFSFGARVKIWSGTELKVR